MPGIVVPSLQQHRLAGYGCFPAEIDRDWLGRVCHLSTAEVALIQRRTDPATQLGYAAQLVTVRAIGTFQADPTAVPGAIVTVLARQLDINEPGVLSAYRDMPVRWRHTAEIRARYGDHLRGVDTGGGGGDDDGR